MKISLLHPSRGRPDKSFDTTDYWFQQAGILDKHEIELIVSIDEDDPRKYAYEEVYSGWHTRFNDNKSVVDATNYAANLATGDILVYLSDDFKCPDNWAELVLKEFENENRPLVLRVDDCLQKNNVPVLTIPIMNRALYERLGYFWHPEYKSMFCDVDLYYTAQHIGALKNAFHLKFPHEHHSIGKAENDDTYRRSEANWKQGEEVFNRRKRQGFPI